MQEFFNEYGGIISIIALLLTIPLAIVANLWTPKVKDWLAGTSARRRDARVKRLRRELDQATEWLTTPSLLIAYGIQRLTLLMLEISAAIILFLWWQHNSLGNLLINQILPLLMIGPAAVPDQSGFSFRDVLYMLDLIAINLVVNDGINTWSTIKRVTQYKEYRNEVETQIRKLDATISTDADMPNNT